MTNQDQKAAMLPLITGIIELGYRIQLFCESPISNQSSSISLVMTEMDACDEMTLYLSTSEGHPAGGIFLVWGNDDMPNPINNYMGLPISVDALIERMPHE
jgi:hypothetical protein